MKFDYEASAELFLPDRKGGRRQSINYRHFTKAADAIHFAIEDFPAMRTHGAWMQVGDHHFDSDEIRPTAANILGVVVCGGRTDRDA